jgi:hypothetical protein
LTLAFLIVRFIRWTWPLMLWLCGAMVDIGLGAGKFEGRGAEVFSLCHCLLDLRDSRAASAWGGVNGIPLTRSVPLYEALFVKLLVVPSCLF